MRTSHLPLIGALIAITLSTGCASYRVDSNIPAAENATGTAMESAVKAAESAAARKPALNKVLISEGSLPNQKYKEIGLIEVSVKKLTVFHKDPTKEQADDALREKAVAIGADAVLNVTYKSGIGFTTWGFMDAEGTGVKFEN